MEAKTPIIDQGVTNAQQPHDSLPLYPDLQHGPPRPEAQVTMATAAVVLTPLVGPSPTSMTCSSCRAEIITRVDTSATTKTHLFALILCLIGCWPCVCVPYCVDSCQSSNHYCPNCNAYLGSYKK